MGKKLSLYEIADIIERVSIATLGGKKAHDYGTGDTYTSIEVHTVGYIANCPGCTVTEIAAEWGKTKSAVSQMVKKLKKAGIVKTEADCKDEKLSHLYLTDKGQELDKAHRAFDEHAWQKSIEGLQKNYSSEEINNCFLILRDWLKVIDPSYKNLLEETKSISKNKR